MRMIVVRTTISIFCLILLACGDDPAGSVKIISRAAPVTTVYTPPSAPGHDMLSEYCPPASGTPGPSTFVVRGPCPFEQHALVDCESSQDDFIVALPRPAKKDATVVVYLNVEHYSSPGAYDGAQLFVAAESGTTLFRWSNDNVHAIVGAGEAYVTLPKTELKAEGMRFGCNRLIGPDSNYTYQCAAETGTTDAAEMISGKLQCRH